MKLKWQEWKYWYILRRAQRVVPWIAKRLPKKLKYWVIIHAMVEAEPNNIPTSVSGMEMLDLYSSERV